MSPSAITKVVARQIFDSRGNPTVECDVYTYKGMYRAAVPSGASTGIYEAVELRDGDKAKCAPRRSCARAARALTPAPAPQVVRQGRAQGCGQRQRHHRARHGGACACQRYQAARRLTRAPAAWMQGKDPTKQRELDEFMNKELDGTDNKGKLGANAILAVSMAICKAGAAERGIPLYKHISELAGNPKLVLPVPAFNVINGGSHAGNALAMQEFMILPTGAASFSEAMRMGSEVYHTLKGVIKSKYGQDACNVGDEGGFAPNISSNMEGLELLATAIEKAGYTGKVKIGMDVAASEFLTEDKSYDLNFKVQPNDGSQKKTGDEMIELYKQFAADHPIISIEDPFDQDDIEHTTKLTALNMCQIVGDDLLVTNPKRVAAAIEGKWCNALLLKVNQIGTVTESIEAVGMAKGAGWGVMASHRSGETEDTFIADLAVGLSTGQIKTGAPCRSERLAKYNQLLRIEEELGEDAVYAGENYRLIAWLVPRYVLFDPSACADHRCPLCFAQELNGAARACYASDVPPCHVTRRNLPFARALLRRVAHRPAPQSIHRPRKQPAQAGCASALRSCRPSAAACAHPDVAPCRRPCEGLCAARCEPAAFAPVPAAVRAASTCRLTPPRFVRRSEGRQAAGGAHAVRLRHARGGGSLEGESLRTGCASPQPSWLTPLFSPDVLRHRVWRHVHRLAHACAQWCAGCADTPSRAPQLSTRLASPRRWPRCAARRAVDGDYRGGDGCERRASVAA
jgi:enolase